MPDRHTYPPPPPPPSEGRDSARPPEGERRDYSDRRAIADLLRKGLEAGRGTLEKNLGESFFPKDAAAQLVSAMGDLRQGVVTAVAQEVGRFLRQADIASEMRQVLTGLQVEAKIQLSFKESEAGSVTTKVEVDQMRTSAKRRRGRDSGMPPPDDAPEDPQAP